ncbi:MAG: hypothetical protein OXR84_14340 [Magnetovibrio sp.]|nr:hypothetical protein [Magnetovibrio sp.]
MSLSDLRHRVAKLERPALLKSAPGDALQLGVAEIDGVLPWGGLAPACLHEIGAAQPSTPAVGFAAALLGRAVRKQGGTVLWCRSGRELYAPGLTPFGLTPDNLIVARGDGRDILWAMEEGLRSGALAAVLGELRALPPTALRRLQLAAETGGTLGFLLNAGRETAGSATTRWRVRAAESRHPRGPWPGRPCWQLDLLRCRGGEAASWLVEWRDERHTNDNIGPRGAGGIWAPAAPRAPGRLALAEPLRHGQGRPAAGRPRRPEAERLAV